MMFHDFCQSAVGMWYIQADASAVKQISLIFDEPNFKAKPNEITTDCVNQLKEYFNQNRRVFDLKLDLSQGSEFYQQVWKAVAVIPYGKTISYLEIAQRIENPKAVRAVGMANGRNPFPIVIPCHRVIASSGALQGYASGLEVKKFLLKLENPKRFVEQLSLF